MSLRKTVRVLGLLLFLGTGAAWGDARESYRNGLNALEDGRHADAERLFREAIAERPEERSGGGLRRTYLPHYYLGVVLSREGRCREALESWKTSEGQGQVQRVAEEGAELPRLRQRCLERVGAFDAARTAADQAVARARKASQTIGRLRESPELLSVWSRGEPSFAAREEAARGQLEEAARLLGTPAGEDPTPHQQAKALANQAAAELDAIRSDAQTRLTEIRDAASSALDRLEAAEAAARARLTRVEYLKPYPPVLRNHVAALAAALGETVEKKATASPAELARLREALNAASGQVEQAAQGPPETLRSAVEAFLAGRYEDVVATLEGETYHDPRATGEACLIRSAARFEILEQTRGEDRGAAAALYEDVVGCQKVKPAGKISTRFFSPRFLRYYENPPEPELGAEEVAADPSAEEDKHQP